MADGLYIGMAGAVARAEQLDTVADNLANAQTPGFKARRPAFEAFLPAGAEHLPGTVAYPALSDNAVNLASGVTQSTGRALDVLPDDSAFLVVELAEGLTGYTRDGRLTVSSDGDVLANGRPVLGTQGEHIQVPSSAKVEVDRMGRVLADGQPVAELSRAALSGPLARQGLSTYTLGMGAVATPASVPVRSGVVELGNQPALASAVELITAQRHFESAMQALQTSRRLDERATEVGKVR